MTQLSLFVPDRFDALKRRAAAQLKEIVVPVDAGLDQIQSLVRDMAAAGRGGFLILRGDSGSGKSTFLSTLDLFLDEVEVAALTAEHTVKEVLESIGQPKRRLRVIVLEGRDALRDVDPRTLEAAIHAINAFIRGAAGERTLIVWPVNADDLEARLVETAQRVGADSLLGVGEPSYRFSGPPQSQYLDVASKTVAALNQGASLADLGISDERANALATQAGTIGQFLGLIRSSLLELQGQLDTLLKKERCRLWIVVASANDTEGDIAGLTRGASSAVDIERLMSATEANVVQELKRFPDKLGILGSVLDAKLLLLPPVTALAIARDFADDKLSALMTANGLSTARQNDAQSRLESTDLAKALKGETMGTRTRGPKPGTNTVDAFKKLAEIASKNDVALNRSLGKVLTAAQLITKYELEKDLGTGLKRKTDLFCETTEFGVVRLELMWRSKSGRAGIANYTLGKLYNYGRAIGFLDDAG